MTTQPAGKDCAASLTASCWDKTSLLVLSPCDLLGGCSDLWAAATTNRHPTYWPNAASVCARRSLDDGC